MMWDDEAWRSLIAFFMVMLVIMFGLGVLATLGLPKIWEWLKPIIHAVTA
jgi:hypothetical protein